MAFSPRALNTSHPHPLKILIPLFPDFNTFDANGPIEVLSQANRNSDSPEFFQLFIAGETELTKSVEGISIARDISLIDALARIEEWDIVLLPGGVRASILEILKRHEDGEKSTLVTLVDRYLNMPDGLTLTVCTGSLFLAALGKLDKRTATSHWAALGSVKTLCAKTKSKTNVVRARWVDSKVEGLPRLITAGGVACGIDATFHLVELIAGPDVATMAADAVDYQRRGDELQENYVIPDL
ncbi:putative amidotransferase-domain-containing protein [Rhexocercosporidium sp. MPI-PUGE-AT-0058]|nr:putative amidotransferase-domain-containing protein [Rhexocercosporidium sp. MPI-PUGE-AT-0058]